MTIKRSRLGLLAAACMTTPAVMAEANISGEMLGNTCAACHGTYGGVNGQIQGEAMPPLAGMAEDDFVKAMKSFQDGSRPATIMDRVAKGFTDEEIRAMAAFFVDKKY